LEVEKLSAPMGAAVTGLDVKAVDQDTFKELDRLFCQHQVLVFPKQELTPNEQMNFASHWGSLVRHPYAGHKKFPELIELKNQGKSKDVNQHWHTDMSYNHLPPKLTMLYAIEVPSFGGDTAFANQVMAYEEMSAGLRSTVDSLRALHTAENWPASTKKKLIVHRRLNTLWSELTTSRHGELCMFVEPLPSALSIGLPEKVARFSSISLNSQLG